MGAMTNETASMVSGVILAGGASSRFGSDKAVYPLAGMPFVLWVSKRLALWCDEVLVVRAPGSEPWRFDLPAGTRVVFDEVPFLGPLAGIARGLECARHEWVLAAACDAPLLRSAVIARLLELRQEADAVTCELDGRLQPFPALYRRTVALPAFRAALAEGERSVRGALKRLRVVRVPEAQLRAIDPDLATFRNANTSDTAAELQATLLDGGDHA